MNSIIKASILAGFMAALSTFSFAQVPAPATKPTAAQPADPGNAARLGKPAPPRPCEPGERPPCGEWERQKSEPRAGATPAQAQPAANQATKFKSPDPCSSVQCSSPKACQLVNNVATCINPSAKVNVCHNAACCKANPKAITSGSGQPCDSI